MQDQPLPLGVLALATMHTRASHAWMDILLVQSLCRHCTIEWHPLRELDLKPHLVSFFLGRPHPHAGVALSGRAKPCPCLSPTFARLRQHLRHLATANQEFWWTAPSLLNTAAATAHGFVRSELELGPLEISTCIMLSSAFVLSACGLACKFGRESLTSVRGL